MKWLYICLAAVVLLTAFIFYNSAKSSESSHADSIKLEEVLLEDMNIDINRQVDYIVRKIAHLLEFSLLGVAAMALLLQIHRHYGRTFYGFGCFYLLAVGVADEYIQYFSGRTSLIADVLLDLVGALFGMAVILCLRYLTTGRKKKDTERKESTGGVL